MWDLIVILFVGLIVGLIARALHPGRQKLGLILTALLGIGGSVLASLVGRFMGWYGPGATAGWIASVLGAVVVLFVYTRLVRR